jgi:uncharacterized protein (TIGR02391 family)
MANPLQMFARIARSANQLAYAEQPRTAPDHPFESRNIHPAFPLNVKRLFDDGHYSQATFEAFKFVDKEVARLSKHSETGFKLMMFVFAEASPLLKLNGGASMSEKDEQKGFQFLFAGSILAIRNPRGHEYAIHDSPDECLDHLALASLLLRRLGSAGFKVAGI